MIRENIVRSRKMVLLGVGHFGGPLDLSAITIVEKLSHLPIVVDPSHATGKASLVSAVSRAAVAAGADGLLIEVHPDPERAWSDGYQSLTPGAFAALMEETRAVASAIGRSL